MPRVTVFNPKCQGGTRQGVKGGRDSVCEWMEEVKEDSKGEPAERQGLQRFFSSSSRTPALCQSQQRSWSQNLTALRPWKEWYYFALVGVLWSVCQVEALVHPPSVLEYVCWRLLFLCLLWLVLGGCFFVLKSCMWLGQHQGEPTLRAQQEIVTENSNKQYTWMSQSRSPVRNVPLAISLANGLLLSVLQEPISDPSVPNIKSLLTRLESVSHTLDVRSEVTVEELDQDSTLTEKVKLIHNYLQQRMRSLCKLVQAQGDFEASVKDMLDSLDGLWAQLEVLHTGVTLNKHGSRGRNDLATARTDAETLSTVLDHYRYRLQSCRAHLKDSTQVLQELTWSHTHMSNNVSSNSESVWPELLLQSNIEQFDKVLESFHSMEQQTSTFQAHLEGLGKEIQKGYAGPACPFSVSPETSDVSLESRNSTASTSICAADAETDVDETPLSLCERSALRVSSTLGRLHKSGIRK